MVKGIGSVIGFLSSLLLVCCGTTARTELIVVVDTNLSVPEQIDNIHFVVTGPDGKSKKVSNGKLKSGSDLPRTLGLVVDEGPLGPLDILIQGQRNKKTIIERAAKVRLKRNKTRIIKLNLLVACLELYKKCQEKDSTCGPDGCYKPGQVDQFIAEYKGSIPVHDGSVSDAMDAEASIDAPSEDVDTGGADVQDTGSEDSTVTDADGDAEVDTGLQETGVEDTGITDTGIRDTSSDVDEQDAIVDCGDGSVDLNSNLDHCGQCDHPCSPPDHGSVICSGGRCEYTCESGWGTCPVETGEACATDITQADMCGDCSVICTGASPYCSPVSGGQYECVASCTTPFSSPCNLRCVNLNNDMEHCGLCDTPCQLDHAISTCSSGQCLVESCLGDWRNCDDLDTNGCEVDLMTTKNHCGRCDTRCLGALKCVDGNCQ